MAKKTQFETIEPVGARVLVLERAAVAGGTRSQGGAGEGETSGASRQAALAGL